MSEPPNQTLFDWAEGDFPHSYFDPELFFTDMDLSGCVFLPTHLSQASAAQPNTYEQGYAPGDLSQAAFVRPSDDYMLEPEAICHDQNITDTTLPSFGDENPPRGSLFHDANIVDVSTTNALLNNNHHAEESEHICGTCQELFANNWDLRSHLRYTGHQTKCGLAGCDRAFATLDERDAHQKRPHLVGHGRTITTTPYDCAQCHDCFQSRADLLRHGRESKHHPYACECGAFFSRLDVLNRHLDSLGTDDPLYPCKYCKRHRGADGFRRKDHLTQHIRNYHHHKAGPDVPPMPKSRLVYAFPVCSHDGCPQYRDAAFKQLPRKVQDENKPFSSLSAYTKHMREEHCECNFPCDVLGCSRVGRRGYFREKDLLKHRTKEHPDAAPYQLTKRDLRHRCTDCGKDLDPSSLHYHVCMTPRTGAPAIMS